MWWVAGGAATLLVVLVAILFLALALIVEWTPTNTAPFIIVGILMLLLLAVSAAMLVVIAQGRRRRHITVDGRGLRFEGRGGDRSLSWDELGPIRVIRHHLLGSTRLILIAAPAPGRALPSIMVSGLFHTELRPPVRGLVVEIAPPGPTDRVDAIERAILACCGGRHRAPMPPHA